MGRYLGRRVAAAEEDTWRHAVLNRKGDGISDSFDKKGKMEAVDRMLQRKLDVQKTFGHRKLMPISKELEGGNINCQNTINLSKVLHYLLHQGGD